MLSHYPLTFHAQEQPLLLEDLLEQEKREQERQAASVVTNDMAGNVQPNNSGLLNDHDFVRALRADVLSSAPQGMPSQGMMTMQQAGPGQQPQIAPQQPSSGQFVQQHPGAGRPQFAQRSVGQQQWRPQMPNPNQLQQQVALSSAQQQPQLSQIMQPAPAASIEQTTVKKEG